MNLPPDLPRVLQRAASLLPSDRIAAEASRAVGDACHSLLDAHQRLSPRWFGLTSGFFYLPFAQALEWGVTDERWLLEFATTVALGHAHFACQDLLVDTGRIDPELALLSDVYLLLYLDRLRLLDAGGGRYDALHHKYYEMYSSAILADVAGRYSLGPLRQSAIALAGWKAAPGCTVLHVVADRAGRDVSGGPLATAVLTLCSGFQLVDDYVDMEEDYAGGHSSAPVRLTVYDGLGLREWPDHTAISQSELRVAAIVTGVGEIIYGLAREEFIRSNTMASTIEATAVQAIASWRHQRAGVRQNEIGEMRRRLDA